LVGSIVSPVVLEYLPQREIAYHGAGGGDRGLEGHVLLDVLGELVHTDSQYVGDLGVPGEGDVEAVVFDPLVLFLGFHGHGVHQGLC